MTTGSDPGAETEFRPAAGACVRLSLRLRRVVADNPGPFTFTGTCSYIVGTGRVAILDPGPDLPGHVARLLDSVRGETVTHIVVSHTHRDHSPASRALAAATGATIVGCAPYRSAAGAEASAADSRHDLAYNPQQVMAEGDSIEGPDWRLEALSTPGHAANHTAFVLPQDNALLSADHVMAWATTVIGPPDGSMTSYMSSLNKLRGRPERIYWPGHGGPVSDPQRYIRALIHHRHQREVAILGRLKAGDRTTAEMVAAIYVGLDPALLGGARMSIFAHLEDLVARGLAMTEGPPRLDGAYTPALR